MNMKKSPHPQWVLVHKKKGTELRLIRGRYYLYEYKTVYNKLKKRPKKISGRLLGSITKADGFIPSGKHELEQGISRKTAIILSWDDEGLVYDWETNAQAQYTGYNCKKYEIVSIDGVPEASPDWQINAFEDFMVIRFADVLLMAAELELNAGNSGTALDYVNRVRERAFGDNSHNYSSLTIDDIFQERKLELAFEGIRYWDILRSCKGDFSKLADILTYVDENDGGDFSQTSDVVSLDVDGNNFVATKGLFQIPQNEIDLMEGIIEQNPGYE